MKITSTNDERKATVYKWLGKPDEDSFLWLPRMVEDESWRWLETVERRTAIEFGFTTIEDPLAFEQSDLTKRATEVTLTYNYYPKESSS